MRLLAALLLLLAGCDDGESISRPPPRETGWDVRYSHGVPAPEGDTILIPEKPGSIHYVVRPGSLRGKSTITMRFRMEADDPKTHFYGRLKPGICDYDISTAVTLYFQHEWGGDGSRWWATFATKEFNSPGEFEIVAPLNGPWTSVETTTAENNPDAFEHSKRYADTVGFTFRNCDGYGHGAYATGPARMVVTAFEIS